MRYFLEVAYKGTSFAGFQVQENAPTIQQALQEALETYYRVPFFLTGSSRTDAGVHALQNFFHVDTEVEIAPNHLYNINAILPRDVVLTAAHKVAANAHARFDALSREYKYFIYNEKNPFYRETAWFYPYPLSLERLNEAAATIANHNFFQAFSKRNVQVYTFNCTILESEWIQEGELLVYRVKANRFLRGMVRALVATMLRVGRGALSIEELKAALVSEKSRNVDFSAPAHGLFLVAVEYPKPTFEK